MWEWDCESPSLARVLRSLIPCLPFLFAPATQARVHKDYTGNFSNPVWKIYFAVVTTPSCDQLGRGCKDFYRAVSPPLLLERASPKTQVLTILRLQNRSLLHRRSLGRTGAIPVTFELKKENKHSEKVFLYKNLERYFQKLKIFFLHPLQDGGH